MKRAFLILLVVATTANAQDVLTIGAATGMPGGSVTIPVSVRDVSGTALGSDAGSGNRIQGIAFKVLFPIELVDSVTFTRAGLIGTTTPLLETTLQGSGFMAYIVSFSELANPIAFTLNASPPGNQIGNLTVSLRGDAANGSLAALTFDAPSATLSNQAGTVRETVAGGNLALVNGSVTVDGSAAPSSLVATALTASSVSLSWVGVSFATHYEVWRSFNGAPYSLIGTTSNLSFSNNTGVVGGTTYLYRVRAVLQGGGNSGFSNPDAATTIFFTDDPLLALTTLVKAVHITQLRTAVNAFRASASLQPLDADATVASGAVIRAQHVSILRAALNEARTAVGIAPIALTDSTLTPSVTSIKAVHIQELRDGVK